MCDATSSKTRVDIGFTVDREVRRQVAAILAVNDTVRDQGERERTRRIVLDSSELLTRRLVDLVIDLREAA
jgi:predicted thioesterase